MGHNIVDIDDNLRIIGTAHVSTASVELVREQIEEWKPNLVAVELCDSCLLYTSPSPRDVEEYRMPSSA